MILWRPLRATIWAACLALALFPALAFSQIGPIPWGPVLLQGSKIVTATYIGNNSSTTSGTSVTYTSQGIGTASNDRVVVVAVIGGMVGATAQTITMTIGGVSATRIGTTAQDSAGNSSSAAIFALNVTSGTTATIVATFTSSQVRTAIHVWTITGTGGSVTQKDAQKNQTNGSTPAVTLSTNPNGAIIAASGDGINGGASSAISWTNTTGDNTIFWASGTLFSGSHANSTSGSNTTVTATYTGAPNAQVLVAASW